MARPEYLGFHKPESKYYRSVPADPILNCSEQELSKKTEKVARIEKTIKDFIREKRETYNVIGLSFKNVSINPSNSKQYIAHFYCLDDRDNTYRKVDINVTRLAGNHNRDDVSAIINKAIDNCPRELVEIYLLGTRKAKRKIPWKLLFSSPQKN